MIVSRRLLNPVIVLVACAAGIVGLSPRAAFAQDAFRVYLGTYGPGIYQCEFNAKDGSLGEPKLAVETPGPSFLAIDPEKRFLYAVNEGKAQVSSFAIDAKTGGLSPLNTQPSQGGSPCHLIVDPAGKHVLAANFMGGSCICLAVEADGKLGKATSFQQHAGPRKHAHCIHLDKAGQFAFCCDLGLDQVVIYRYDAAAGTLTPHGTFNTPKGAGPRHFAWHPDGKTAYVNGETDLTAIVCDYDAEKGKLTQKQVVSTLPEGTEKKGGSTAEIVVHPSGKFVYVSNRHPYNSIAVFAVDEATKQLKPVGHQAAGVNVPRNFAVDPSGRWLLVGNQWGNSVIVFKIDPATGLLEPTKTTVKVPSPVCVRFVPLP